MSDSLALESVKEIEEENIKERGLPFQLINASKVGYSKYERVEVGTQTITVAAVDLAYNPDNGEVNLIPFYTVISGGVQVMSGLEYAPPTWAPGNFLMHLNCWLGPGSLKTMPLATPRWGATYNLTFDIADNPDGGPLNKGVAIHILVNDEKSGNGFVMFNVSNPEAERQTIVWQTVNHIFVGTGETTTIVFESATLGSFGVLIDNVGVALVNLLDNGSFDMLNPPGIDRDNETFFNVLTAPNDVIINWAVTDGAIKWSGNERWRSSTDGSFYLLDMNGNSRSGTIISGKIYLTVGAVYTILYDTAANPDTALPLKGDLLLIVTGVDSGNIMATKIIHIDGTGFSQFSIGWRTGKLEFTNKETAIYLTFSSKIAGELGPLLDNVAIFKIMKVGAYTSRGIYGVMKSKAVVAMHPIHAIFLSLFGGVLLLWSLDLISSQ